MQNDIKFNRGEGGLGRPLTGEDHISGFVTFVPNGDLPAGFSTTDRIKLIYSPDEAEALGITSTVGTPEEIVELHTQIADAFAANEGIVVYVAIFPVTGSAGSYATDLTLVTSVQRFAEGKIRQMAVMNNYIAFLIGQLTSLQSVADLLESEHTPLSFLYSANMSAITNSALTDLRLSDYKNVSVVIGRDFERPVATLGYFPSCIGLALGTLSLAAVHESIAWIGKFNVNRNPTNAFDVPALTTSGGSAIKTLAKSLVDAINDKGYIFLKKHIGRAGTYFNESSTAKSATSDYAFIENNRTIDKAVRTVRTFLLPSLNAPLYVNEDGTLTEDTIASYRNDALRGLDEMVRVGEISARDVIINPAQNVLSLSKLVITIKIVPVGVARNIEVNIGFAVKITQ